MLKTRPLDNVYSMAVFQHINCDCYVDLKLKFIPQSYTNLSDRNSKLNYLSGNDLCGFACCSLDR